MLFQPATCLLQHPVRHASAKLSARNQPVAVAVKRGKPRLDVVIRDVVVLHGDGHRNQGGFELVRFDLAVAVGVELRD